MNIQHTTAVIRNDIVLIWRQLGGPRSGSANWALLAGMLIAVHAMAFYVYRQVSLLPPALIERQGSRATAIALIVAGFWAFSTALSKSADALSNRSELGFFLSSPVSARHLFMARYLSICLSAAALPAIILFPLANIAAVFGRGQWLGIYVVVAELAAIAGAVAMMVASLAFAIFGVRTGRSVVKTVGVFSALMMVIPLVAPIPLGAGFLDTLFKDSLMPALSEGAVLGPKSPVWFLGHAVFGNLAALLGIAMFCFLTIILTELSLSKTYYRQAREIEPERTVSREGERRRWQRGVFFNVIIKEWRCILRDPKLLGDILFQGVLLLIPVLVGVQWLAGPEGVALDYVYPAIVAFAASVAGSLAWIAMSTDEARTLMVASPSAIYSKWIKLSAILLPLWILLAPVMLAGIVVDPLRGMSMTLAAYSATFSVGAMNIWQARAAKRSDLNRRGSGTDAFARILEMIAIVAWGAVAYGLALNGTIALAGGCGVICTLVLARIFRTRSI